MAATPLACYLTNGSDPTLCCLPMAVTPLWQRQSAQTGSESISYSMIRRFDLRTTQFALRQHSASALVIVSSHPLLAFLIHGLEGGQPVKVGQRMLSSTEARRVKFCTLSRLHSDAPPCALSVAPTTSTRRCMVPHGLSGLSLRFAGIFRLRTEFGHKTTLVERSRRIHPGGVGKVSAAHVVA